MIQFAIYALALLGSLTWAAAAHAQVAVLRIDPEAEQVCRDIERALEGVGVVEDPGYLNEAQQQAVDPTSDASLELITPLLSLKLAVVPMSVDDTGIEVEYRDGRTGKKLGSAHLPRERGKLGRRGREQLRADVVGYLAAILEGHAGVEPRDAAEGDASELEQPDAEQAEQAEPAPRALRAIVRIGMGVGMRDVTWTLDGEDQRVELGAFPAIDLGLALPIRLSDGLWLVPALAYQSSLFFQEVEEARMAAPPEQTGVRSHRFAGSVGLEVRLGGERSASITPALGVGVRNLRPEVHHLSTPAYSLAGPLVSIGVHLPLGDTFALRVAPEAQYLFVGEGLRERDVQSTGLCLGGELALSIQVMRPIALELAYREAHALLSSPDGSAGDVERFITLRGVGTL